MFSPRQTLAIESEKHTRDDLSSSVNHLQTTLNKLKDQSTSLSNEVRSVEKIVRTERAEKERQETSLEEMRLKDEPELRGLEDVLGWKVEGVKGGFQSQFCPLVATSTVAWCGFFFLSAFEVVAATRWTRGRDVTWTGHPETMLGHAQ